MLPVWVLLTPRDYLSTFMKVGVIVLLAVGLVLAAPVLQSEAVTDFALEGTGPVFAGKLSRSSSSPSPAAPSPASTR